MAAAIPVKTRDRIKAAGLQRLTENIRGLGHIFQKGDSASINIPHVATTTEDHASLCGIHES
jgi:hypothetical protein